MHISKMTEANAEEGLPYLCNRCISDTFNVSVYKNDSQDGQMYSLRITCRACGKSHWATTDEFTTSS